MRHPFALLLACFLAGCSERAADPFENDAGASAAARTPHARPVDPASAALRSVFDEARVLQWKLPKRLREISGLALTEDARLFAIADEEAEVVEIDYVAGDVRKRFVLGQPVLRGDFEGLAVVGDLFYTITSEGMLYRFGEAEDRSSIGFVPFDTGLRERCEVEGLAHDSAHEALLIACKTVYGPASEREVWFFRFDLVAHRLEPMPVGVPLDELAGPIDKGEFSPSGIAVLPDGESVVVVAARQRAVARLQKVADGFVVDEVIRLPGSRHKQTEGVAVLANGSVLLADEGGNKRGRLARYGQP